MKKYFIITVALVLLLWLGFPVMRNSYWYKMNPFKAFIASVSDETHWSPGYFEKAFDSIELGITSEAVQKILGTALSTTVYNKKTVWHYTTGPNGKPQSLSDGSTHVRGICFDKNMKVEKKLKYFYFD